MSVNRIVFSGMCGADDWRSILGSVAAKHDLVMEQCVCGGDDPVNVCSLRCSATHGEGQAMLSLLLLAADEAIAAAKGHGGDDGKQHSKEEAAVEVTVRDVDFTCSPHHVIV